MGYTGYENLTDEQIEDKLRSVQLTKHNLEREKRHRKEAAEREKHKDIIGKFFQHKEDPYFIFRIDGIKDGEYVGKVIRFSSDAGKYLMPISTDISFTIMDDFGVDDLAEWIPVDKEKVELMIDEWKTTVNVYINF